MRRLRSRGGVLPMFALCLAVLCGFAGMAVDVGFLEYRQQAQQSATDAAALGAAQVILYKGCPNQTSAQSEADNDASNNAFSTQNTNVSISVNNPPTSGPYSGNNCAVAVSITTKNVNTWFSRVFSPMASGATETTSAVGVASYTGPGCLYVLTTTQQSDMSNGHITSPKCGIYINDSANFSNGSFDAASILYAGSGNNVSGATFPLAQPEQSLPFADPCPEIPGCAYMTANPPSTSSNCTTNGNYNSVTIVGGCYASLQLQGTNTLSGTITVNGQLNFSNATVNTGTGGVTLQLTSNASNLNFSNSTLNLTAPTSGSYENMIIYRPGSQSSAVDFSTCTCNWNGVVYFPTSKVNVSNVGSRYVTLIFGQVNFSNSTNFNDSVPTSGTYVGQAVLGE